MPRELRRQVTDVAALRAVADPIRYRILGHLMAVGPQTASQCAAVVGATPSNCSYHLRELARYGLVERVEAGSADGRERLWRPAATGFSYDVPEDQADHPVATLARKRLIHAGIDDEADLAHAAVELHDQLPVEWQEVDTLATYGLRVSPEELRDLVAKIDALIRPYIGLTRDDVPPNAEAVHVGFSAFRRPGS